MARIKSFSHLFTLFVYAQVLPDSVWFISAGGDTLSLTVAQLKGNCWGAVLYEKRPTGWQLVRRDTFCIDERHRLTLHLRYDSTGSVLLSRVRGLYPSLREAIFTQEKYESPQRGWMPGLRLHLWSTSQRWDSMLSGWYGLWFLGANSIQGSALWCYPFMTSVSQWGDSLLYEEFLSSAQLFVERGGYIKTAYSSIGCDTLLSYGGLRISTSVQGKHTLCKRTTTQLIAIRESLQVDTTWVAIDRDLVYNGNALIDREIFVVRRYRLSGEFLNSLTYNLRYVWDASGRLIEAHYPVGVYYLRYSRSQVVALPSLLTLPTWETKPTSVRIYTLLGSYIGELEGNDLAKLDLPPGVYLLEREGIFQKICLLP